MPPRVYATIGRAPDNDVVLDDPTVSGHHARLSWAGTTLLVEDLSSVNGTFVDGERVKNARTRPGAELRCGEVALPWSHDGLRTLLKAGAGARTLLMPKGVRPSYVCRGLRPRRCARGRRDPDLRGLRRHAAHGHATASRRRQLALAGLATARRDGGLGGGVLPAAAQRSQGDAPDHAS